MFLNHNNVGLCGLLETRVRKSNFVKVYGGVCASWSIVTNYQSHQGGRIWLIWCPSKFEVYILECNAQYIHGKILHKATGKKFSLTVIYSFNDAKERESLWNGLITIHKRMKGPWIIGGDFNNVLNLNERLGSAVMLEEVIKFRECMRECGLSDHCTTGPFFTWRNNQEGDNRVCSKIDRVMANEEWGKEFENALACFLPETVYDHNPCVVQLDKEVTKRPRSFRFFNMWTKAPEFLNTVQEVWQQRTNGVPMFKVVTRLKQLKKGLKVLNKDRYSNIEQAADEARIMLVDAQIQLHKEPMHSNLQQIEAEARRNYMEKHEARMSFIKQKVKQEWISSGDQNSRYFHACLRKRRVQNQICRIQDKNGVWKEKQEDIEEAFIQYYKELLGSTYITGAKVSKTKRVLC
ncbi:uncharacterized protein LOC125495655 [Beta vulgaris subsp. vulgaris]|uniref:uncharacterized protein LOC125495655 n=1 Tax=Beta vulgaris subsp. vulgaris TaxID=3555 RepID=UPI0020367BA8|nr:uncharacterized protein LOC125495655 [Beta vulgaris subsp. vulgaris]